MVVHRCPVRAAAETFLVTELIRHLHRFRADPIAAERWRIIFLGFLLIRNGGELSAISTGKVQKFSVCCAGVMAKFQHRRKFGISKRIYGFTIPLFVFLSKRTKRPKTTSIFRRSSALSSFLSAKTRRALGVRFAHCPLNRQMRPPVALRPVALRPVVRRPVVRRPVAVASAAAA